MREKTKDLISDLILEEIKECHDTRHQIRKIIREEIKTIREELGMEYHSYYLRGYIEAFDYVPPEEIFHGTKLCKLQMIFETLEQLKTTVYKRIQKLEELTNASDYTYATNTETKLVKIKKADGKTATESIKEKL